MSTIRLKIVGTASAILLMVLPNAAMAAMGSSTNYILDVANTSNTGVSGSSANYTVTNTTDEGFEAYSSDYSLCGGYIEEALGTCVPPTVPTGTPTPSTPSAGGSAGVIPWSDSDELLEEEISPEEEIDSLIITFDENVFGEQPEVPEEPGEPPIGKPGSEGGAPDVTEPPVIISAPEITEPAEGGFSVKKPYDEALLDKTGLSERDDVELYGALDEEKIITPEIHETEDIPVGLESIEQPLKAAAEELPTECTWLLILFIILTLILGAALMVCRLCITKKTKQRIKKDIHNCMIKFIKKH